MLTVQVNDVTYSVDAHGHLRDPGVWSEDVARHLAALEGFDLGDKHWKVIRYLRACYLECGTIPMFRKICGATGLKLGEMYALFPPRPIVVACRLAGLPKP